MEKEKIMDFEMFTVEKEKRRISRTKGKRTYDKTKINKCKQKHRNVLRINYDPDIDDLDLYDNYINN